MTQEPTSRRAFVKKSLAILSVAPFVGIALQSASAQAATPLSESDPLAQTMGYVHDAAKTDTKKFPKRAEAGGENQFCKTCMFYNSGGQTIEGHEGKWGKCTIFVNGLVNENGWCNSWAPKA